MKRVKSSSRNCPNPLFEKWLTEWRDEAKAKGSSVESHFAKAIESLQKYPLPLTTGRDCILLQHFGVKLCAMLDKRLKKHWEARREAHNSDTERVETCDDVENDILLKKSRSLEGNEVEPRRNDSASKTETKSVMNEQKNKDVDVEKTRENHEIRETAGFGASQKNLSPGSIRNNRIRRRSRAHSISSSDSDCSNPVTNEALIGGNTKKTPERLASRDNDIEENCKVARKISNKKRLRQIDVAVTGSSGKAVEDTEPGAEDQFHMGPDTFDIILLVDNHETSGGKTKAKDDQAICELDRLSTPYEVRHLKVGDFSWIARCRDTKRELVLPYTVERKRMDDLASSIKDGRFHEQKFRLRQSGIPNVIYMIESHGKNQHLGMPLPTLLQASTNSMVQDGFTVKFTENHKHSMQYLSILTTLIHRIFKDKHLVSSSKEDLDSHCIVSFKVPLMEFKEFNKAASKVKTFKVRDMFVRHLLQLKGLSLEKALAIVELYPTPMILTEAFRRAGTNGEKLLAGIKVGSLKRQLGPALSKTIFDLYTKRSLD